MKKDLFMYDTEKLDTITYFQMELGFTFKQGLINKLLSKYTNISIVWNDFDCTITTEDGLFSGIGFQISTETLKVYKNKRNSDLKFIFLYYDKAIKSIRDINTCDSDLEYDWLLNEIITPITNIIKRFETSELVNAYIVDEEIEIVSKMTRREHTHWVNKIERFAKEIKAIYNYEVVYTKYLYHTLDFYMFSRVGNIAMRIGDDFDSQIVFDFNQSEDKVKIVSNNREVLYQHEALIHVANRIHDLKEYTLYDRNILKTEKNKLDER